MIAKVKTATFIDTLRFELVASSQNPLKAVLRDDKGSICSEFETIFVKEEPVITWKGLNDLPYGVYTFAGRRRNKAETGEKSVITHSTL